MATDRYIDTLKALSSDDAPLAVALRELRRAARDPSGQPPAALAETLGALTRELATLRTGSKRILNQLDQLQALVRTSAVINSSLDIVRVLEEVMDTTIELTNAERAFLMLRVEGSDELELRAARNWDRETVADQDATFSRSVMQTVLETAEPVVTLNAQGDARFQGNVSVLMHDLRSVMCIPMSLRGRVIGVLYTDNRMAQGVFDQESVELVATFANYAAIAIDNARSFMRVRADLDKAKQEVRRLQIEINQRKVDQELAEITDTDYFQRISQLANDLRQKRSG